MNYIKGFAPIIVIMVILAIAVPLGGGVVYLNNERKEAETRAEEESKKIEELHNQVTQLLSTNSTTTATSTEDKTMTNTSEKSDTKPTVIERIVEKIVVKETPSENTNKDDSKTFTTPSGAVIDENGNIISPPTNNSGPDLNVEVGKGALSSAEIYAAIEPSVVLITSSKGVGAGFVVENGRYILTNAHVVDNDEFVNIRFSNGISYEAYVLGRNTTIDLAVIASGIHREKAVQLGSSDSESLLTGSDLYALGFPLNLTNTVTITKGILSNRITDGGQTYLQTDISTHPGNSGGPIVNNKGEVVGMHIAGFSVENIKASGIAFEIPINTIKNYIPVLSGGGTHVFDKYPYMGSIDIPRSMVFKMRFNEHLTCEQHGYKQDPELELCNLYENHYYDFQWNIVEDM